MTVLKQERFSAYSHLFGAMLALVGLVQLTAATRGAPAHRLVAAVYGVSLVAMFMASTLYHARKQREDDITFWRKLDHSAVFFLIAGTYTPVVFVYLEGGWRWSILGVQWGLALTGTLTKMFALRLPRWVTAGTYLAMGWVALVPIHLLLTAMPIWSIAFLLGGAVAYSSGAVIYARKRPDPYPGRFGFHELFHVLVLIGAILHYCMVVIAVSPAGKS